MKNLKLLCLGCILFLEKVKSQYNAYIERFNVILQKEFLIINFLIIFSGIIQKISYYSLNSNILYNIKLENFILKGHHLNNQKYYVYIGQTNT
jgi:hypothetical protein